LNCIAQLADKAGALEGLQIAMHAALLFNSDDPKYKGSYGWPIEAKVFKTGVIQRSGRHMKMSVGDVLTYSNAKDKAHHDALCEAVYFTNPWALLHERRLRQTFGGATVFALIFENMTEDMARGLHSQLTPDKSYLGVEAVEYAYGPHLALFRNSMITKYRIIGRTCRIFLSIGQEDEKDEYEAKELRKLGFTDVGSAKLTAALFSLSPEKSRNPYLAHNKRVIEFFRDALGVRTEK
jgi:hypothetical protein